MRRVLPIVVLVFVLVVPIVADVVVPTSDVVTRVIVRQSASSQSAQLESIATDFYLRVV